MNGRPGVLVIGHGTADPVGAAETRQVAATVASLLPDVPVELGFLEVIAPTIGDAVARLAARGCGSLVAAPLLLFAAGHATRDVPEAVAAAAASQGMDVRQTVAFGCCEEIVTLSRARRHEALAGRGRVAAAETALVMIGRGSSDPAAVTHLAALADAALAGEERPARVELGFVAAAAPRLADALETACDPTATRLRRVLVQPHLLFRGHVEDEVTDAVERSRARRADLEWIQVARLGADPLVARAVIRRIAEVCAPQSLTRQGRSESSQ